MPTFKPTDLGTSKPVDDYYVFDKQRRPIGRIVLHPQAPVGRLWFSTFTAHVPQGAHDRGYEPTREFATVAFKVRWEQSPA